MQLAGHGQPYLSPSYRSCYNSQDTIADNGTTKNDPLSFLDFERKQKTHNSMHSWIL